MKMDQVKEKARALGIKPGQMKKTELIKIIQKTEGNFDCFGTAYDSCDQAGCCWRSDCLTH